MSYKERRAYCKFYQQGRCEHGSMCSFAHSEQDLGTFIGTPLANPKGKGKGKSSWDKGFIGPPPGFDSDEGSKGSFYDSYNGHKGVFHQSKGKGKDSGKGYKSPWDSWDARDAWVAQPQIKRNLCKFFLQGSCEKGPACGFAHSEAELGQPADPDATPPLLAKRTICKFFLEGTCGKGSLCGFAHGEGELGQTIVVDSGAGAPEIKRTLCKFFAEGNCELGVTCGFAHGYEELGTVCVPRVLIRSMCKFHQQGTCEKGDQCLFAHSPDEIGAVVDPRLLQQGPQGAP
eukprot:TRINITY_DN5190_c0_g1_i2.p1 TRINITY_DN5190_c0_g1~~TRINITY_DN5190_c0_g1_i2.p1  ORF type:complete len:287 (-),score=57.83 TRINITY_DN5190_c0_g1_i2:152-1012(-)